MHLGNKGHQTSGSSVYPQKAIGSYLDYDFDYGYAAGYAHRLDHAGGRYYRYDLDGNITMEHHGPIPEGLPGGGSGSTGGGSGSGSDDDFWDDPAGNGQYNGSWDGDMAGDGTGSDDGFWDDLGGNGQYNGSWDGEMAGGSGTGAQQDSSILAVYEWDERDRLVRSQTPDVTAYYVYGEDGQRTNKHTSDSETLYFSRLWTWHDGKGAGDQTSKHIYLGSERIVTQMNGWKGQQTYSEEHHKTYYYHTDHLGSAQLITDWQGGEYQRIEYTPYGEEWVDKFQSENYVYMPYKFTAKERDEETGLYYYGARYLDPMYSIWISPDPALGDYLPTAGADNSSLPGMGGVFNIANFCLYTYARNNPITYIDSDGRWAKNTTSKYTLIKIEDYGFVIIPPKYNYTGNKVYENGENVSRKVNSFRKGKIDGVMLPYGIYKITDDKKNILKNVNVTIKEYKGGFILAYIDSPESMIFNAIGDFIKIFTGDKKSGFYNYGELWEEYIPYAPRQEDLKANIETRKTFFGKEKEVPTFIQYDKIKNLFPEPQEKTN